MKKIKNARRHTKKGVILLEKENSIWKELKKYGIHNEKELDDAISKTKLLNISCFVSKEGVNTNENC